MFCLPPSRFSVFWPTLTTGLVELPTVALGGSALQLRRWFAEILPVFCRLGPLFCACRRFFIHGLGQCCRAAHFQYAQNPDLPDLFCLLHFYHISYFDTVRRFDTLLVLQDTAQFYGIGSQAAGFKKPGCPQPFIDTCGFTHAVLY